MDSMQRAGRGVICAFLALLAGCPAIAESPQARCRQDALGTWFCAVDPNGVAGLDNLGVAVCSPGRCVEVEDEWQCSAVSGGNAVLTSDGPVCEGGCRAPRAVDCDRGMGPS